MNRQQLTFNLTFEPPKPQQLLSPDEIFERVDESLLTALAEDRRIEQKPASFSGSSLAEYVCMWANTRHDGGIIVLGQRDISKGGGFEGCSQLSDKQLNQAEKVGHNLCPDANCKSKRVEVRNLKGDPDFVLVFRVKYHPDIVVKTASGKVFERIGDSKIERKTPEEIRELQADKGQISFEAQESGLSYPQDFDTNAIARFVEQVRRGRGIPESLSTEEVLALRRLGKIKSGAFRPNHACSILFSVDPIREFPGCKVRFQRFDGETELTGDKYNVVKNEVLEGRVVELIRQIEGILDSQLRIFSPLNEKGKFFPVPEYPKNAWYEAIVNACVHRSYGNGLKNMVIFVKMFDDHLVVESPGPFPPYVTPENIYDMHLPRNPILMDAMFYMDYVQCAHEGTRRIRDSMAEMKLPAPAFTQSEVGHSVVRVTLRNNIKQRRAWIDHDVSVLVSEAIAADLSESEKRLLNWTAVNGRITVSDANKQLGISWQGAHKILFRLAEKRIFQYIRFRPHKKDVRDPKAFFRLRSSEPIPDGGFEQVVPEK